MAFDHGDTARQQADRNKPGMLRQQLIAVLNEPSGDGDRSNLRMILDTLVGMAKDQDLAAIREIFDRCDGKAQVAAAAADDREKKVTFEWKNTASSSTTSRDPSSPGSMTGPSASPAS